MITRIDWLILPKILLIEKHLAVWGGTDLALILAAIALRIYRSHILPPVHPFSFLGRATPARKTDQSPNRPRSWATPGHRSGRGFVTYRLSMTRFGLPISWRGPAGPRSRGARDTSSEAPSNTGVSGAVPTQTVEIIPHPLIALLQCKFSRTN